MRRLPMTVVTALLLGAASLGLSRTALAQGTTGTIQGLVTSTAGGAVEGAQIVFTNLETGVEVRVAGQPDGRYRRVGLPVGRYAVQVRAIGYRAVERRGIELNIGEVLQVDFNLTPSPTQLEEVTVIAETQPLTDAAKTGYADLVNANQIAETPTNGRNFADLVALSPAVQLNVGDGSGGNLSLGGGRRGANLIQIDGAGSTGTFFGGEARGSDRVPFAYSIEAVKEFQVVTNGYDVEYGFFAGGVINAVTKSGTNDWRGSVFSYYRGDQLTGNDFTGRPASDYRSWQFGGTLSGPIIRDRMHFYLSLERQDRNEPVFGLPAPGDAPDPSTGVHPDSVARFLTILKNVYGVDETAGRFLQTQNEWAVFGRVDWQLSNRHHLTVRHNYTDLNQQNDRISTNELRGNGGIFRNRGNSTVVTLNSVLSDRVFNEFRAQRATEPRPRDAYSLLPQARVNIASTFGPGVSGFTTAECCNDPVLPNNLEETTYEFANNLNARLGSSHTVKVGAHGNLFDYTNFFFFGQQGEFRFNSLADFENRNAFRYTRALPNPGPDGQFFTADDILPLAVYQVVEFSLYGQDTWELTRGLQVTGGVRWDRTAFPDKAPPNSALESALGYRTDVAPTQSYLSPRLHFSWDVNNDGRSLLRGGVGLFYGRFPAVLYSNSLLNTGGNQLSLFCSGSSVPTPNYQQYAADPRTIPTACAGGGTPSPPTANINAFDPNFDYPKNWKASAGFERQVSRKVRVGVDALFSRTTGNFYVEDRNLKPEQFRSGRENRPVFAPVSGIRSSGSLTSSSQNRISSSFGDVLIHTSQAEGIYYGLVLRSDWQLSTVSSFAASYSWSTSKDNSSYSCCISSTALFETPTSGDPNRLGGRDALVGAWGPSDYDRRHTVVLSGRTEIAPSSAKIQVSGIFRAASGRPFTPIVDGDPNADGRFGNDRAFISSQLLFANPTEDLKNLRRFLSEWDCLVEAAGRVISRNTCRNPWTYTLDLRVRRSLPTTRGQRVELVADFFNVLNLINDDWSRLVGVTGSNTELLRVTAFNAATKTYTYAVNPSFGEKRDLTPFRTDQFSVQLGVRYSF
jgi:outer membrane receptor for ferrienterochelin and colicin